MAAHRTSGVAICPLAADHDAALMPGREETKPVSTAVTPVCRCEMATISSVL
ncbi:hypothetical protein [Phyllobacterium salinisoli]|uniref:hypothetical protein n=1 Tax=Phyllobacterium salinisoli TaxID=1899321 RepID=UPI00135C2852|nr:hypothetical protein [Phyllobacterium salinisoli]